MIQFSISFFFALLSVSNSACLIHFSAVTPDTGAVAGSSQLCVSADPSLVSWWDGDQTSGVNCPDLLTGPSANNGTLSGGVSTGTGKVGSALSFDGSTGTLTLADASNLDFTTGFSISAWIYPQTASRTLQKMQTILAKWGINTSAIGTQANWTGVNTAGASALNNNNYRGFLDGVFDGRYVYFVPFNNGSNISGAVARYDTHGSFTTPASWAGVDISGASALNNVNYRGYHGAVFDGRYVYFIPDGSWSGSPHGNIARYDTTGSFTAPGSWSGVDVSGAGILSSADYQGFNGGIFDGRYLYLIPSNSSGSGHLARYDTQSSFASAASWTAVNIAGAQALNSANYGGFSGAVFDGRYIYFTPGWNGSSINGYLARYDTQGSLTSPASWSGVDISGASALNSANYRGYAGGVFDGRYVYFVPNFRAAGTPSGYVARYDSQGSLTSTGSWSGVDMSGAAILNSTRYRAYNGGHFDGRYVYFVPSQQDSGVMHGDIVRYDTQGAFTSAASWSGADLTSAGMLNSANYQGFIGAVFDGRYLYLIPWDNAQPPNSASGWVARYDTTGSSAAYLLQYSPGDTGGTQYPGLSATINTTTGPRSVWSNVETTAGTWHHVVATYDNSVLALYIDGALVAQTSATGTLANSTQSLSVGSRGGGLGYFNGSLDEGLFTVRGG